MSPCKEVAGKAKRSVVRTNLYGIDLLQNPRLNKGTAFSEEERTAFGLHGILPPAICSLEEQRERRLRVLASRTDYFGKYSNMRDLQNSNETLFYSLIAEHVEEMLPIVYTPAVGEGCQRFSEIWRRPRGLFLSYKHRDQMEQILSDPAYNDVRCIVVSDGERILGLGDQGAGGMGIPIGKMALYTALGGVPPEHCLPILLDVGTDNERLLNDPIYIGWQHNRIRGQEYDDFIEQFVQACIKRWPNVLLQWEDFAGVNAARLLDRYKDRLCTFNDDIQGTAAITTASILAAVNATGVPLKDQRIAMFGSGSAGVGIINLLLKAMQAEGLTEAQARERIYAFNRHGLLVEDSEGMRDDQIPLARKKADVANWQLSGSGPISLLDTVRNAKPTVLVGTSAQAGAFTEEVIREMAKQVERPCIFPLSNPTSKCEAVPEDLMKWTDGRALIATGSPYPPVEVNGRSVRISQCNNSYIFPGLALGILVSNARRVTDNMIMTAARTLATLSPTVKDKNDALLPPIADSRKVGLIIGEAVCHQAITDGVEQMASTDNVHQQLLDYAWEPEYVPYERHTGNWLRC